MQASTLRCPACLRVGLATHPDPESPTGENLIIECTSDVNPDTYNEIGCGYWTTAKAHLVLTRSG
jgi:hypothetical protein